MEVVRDRNEVGRREDHPREKGDGLCGAVSLILNRFEVTDVEADRASDGVGEEQQRCHAEEGEVTDRAAQERSADQKAAAHE